jgi:hypothetical protein
MERTIAKKKFHDSDRKWPVLSKIGFHTFWTSEKRPRWSIGPGSAWLCSGRLRLIRHRKGPEEKTWVKDSWRFLGAGLMRAVVSTSWVERSGNGEEPVNGKKNMNTDWFGRRELEALRCSSGCFDVQSWDLSRGTSAIHPLQNPDHVVTQNGQRPFPPSEGYSRVREVQICWEISLFLLWHSFFFKLRPIARDLGRSRRNFMMLTLKYANFEPRVHFHAVKSSICLPKYV